MRAIVIEDEKNVREGFIKLIQTFRPDVSVIGTADSVEKGIEIIKTNEFDILFLDINLPDGSGFDLIHRLTKKDFLVIFVTAYDKYAIDAFKLSAVDYLLKPVSPDLLIKAIEKAELLTQRKMNPGIEIAASHFADKKQSNKIILKDSESIHIVKLEDIIYCTADGSYTKFITTSNEQILISTNLKEYDNLLSPYRFIRCHHSYLINLNHVKELKKSDGGQLIMSNGMLLPISSRKKVQIMDEIKKVFLN